MNLKKLFDKIAVISKTIDPNIGHVLYGDVYELNHIQTVEYPAVVVTVGNHGANLNDYTLQYRLNIFYIDRLTDDKGNKIDVHANSIVFLNTLLKELDEDLMISEGYEIINFNERFNDVCSGGYVNVRVGVPIEICDMPSIEYITNLKDIKITENGLYKAPYGTAYKNIDVDVSGARLREQSWTFDRNQVLTILPGLGYDGISKLHLKVDVTKGSLFKSLTVLPSNAFRGSDISETDFSDCRFTTVGSYAFYGNTNIVGELKLPNTVTSIDREFIVNTKINKLVLPPLVTAIATELIMNAGTPFEFICNDVVTTVRSYGFYNCSHCPKIDLPATVTSIQDSAFASNYEYLKSIIIRAINPPALGNGAFNNTTGHTIYVPDESVQAYKTATNWSLQADKIKPLSEYHDN